MGAGFSRCPSAVTEYDRLLEQYSVTCFAVIDDEIHGTIPHHVPISPYFASRAQAEQCQAKKRTDFPNCYLAKFENYFNSEGEKGRLELLTQVIGIDQGDLPRLGEFWVRSFIVVQGGEADSERNVPISPDFPSKEQAKAFQALHRAQYPQSQILTRDYAADDDLSRRRWIAQLFPHHSMAVPRPLAHKEPPFAIKSFCVVEGGDDDRQYLPISPYFRTKAEAERFQTEIRAQYPQCRLVEQYIIPRNAAHREALLVHLFGQEA